MGKLGNYFLNYFSLFCVFKLRSDFPTMTNN